LAASVGEKGQSRHGWFNDATKDNRDKNYLACVGRVANRMFTGGPTTQGVPVPSLCLALVERLGCDPNGLSNEAVFRLGAVIFGLYRGAKEAIQSVDMQA
jgi:hypothetical protein